MKSHRRLACPHYGRATIFGLLMASCSATAATAQTAAEGDMDDPNTIVVTAQKREQALQDVPIAISAVSAEDLSNRGVTDLQNLSGSVASLSFTGSFGVGGSTSIGIRGVSGQPLPAGVAPTVAVYVDGEYQPSVFSSFFTLDDVERIEVLRGPQGTLYGRNSTGGAINIVTREPGRELKGGIDLTYGNYNHFLGRGSISGPIADGLSVGVSGSYEKRDGFFTNSVTGNRIGGIDTYTFRGKLAYRSPDDSFKAVLSADISERHGIPTVFNSLYQPFNPATAPFVGNPTPRFITWDALSESRSRGDQKSRGGSLTLQVDLSPSLRLTSLTSIRKEDMLQAYDLDGTATPALLSDIENHDKAFNQELRLNYESERFNLTFGGNYYNNKSQFGALQATPLATRPRAAPYIDTDLKAFALFGQAEFALTDRLTVMAGLRWNTENRDWSVDYRNASLQNGAPFVGLLFTGKVKDDVFIPSAGLDFKLTPDVLLYAKFSRGYQAPGFNGFPGATATAATTFDAENLSAYEIGMKSQFWDRRITLNLAAFHYDYSNLQVRNTIGPGQAQISNAGSAKIDGIEATLSLKLAEGLVVSGNLSYTDARYVTFCEQAAAGSLPFSDPACTTPTGFPGWNRAGNRLNNAPEWQGNIALDYTAKVGGAGELRLNVSYAAASQAFYIPANDPITSNDNAKRVDGRIGFRMNSGIEIYGYVRNLFNTLTNDMGLRGGPTFAVVHTTDPRTFGFGARYRF